MKPLLSVFAMLALVGTFLAPTPAEAANINDQIEVSRSLIQTGKKAVIAEAMNLTRAESDRFWPVYREYDQEIKTNGDRLVKLIQQFGDSYENMTDQKAVHLTNEYIKVEMEQLKIRKKYYKDFQKVLPAKKATKVFQIENKLRAMINYEMATSIPFVETTEGEKVSSTDR